MSSISADPSCTVVVRSPDDPDAWLPCPHPAPLHGVTMSGAGAVAERKPICDEHYAALKAAQEAVLLAHAAGSMPQAEPA